MLIFNPQWYFHNKVEYGNIVIFHRFEEPYDFNIIVNDILNTLKKSKFYRDEYRFKIYLTRSEAEFYFYTPLCRQDFFGLNPIINTIYVSPITMENGKIKFLNYEKYEVLSEIKKACVYSLILQSVDIFSYLAINDWRKKGYAEYLVSETPFFNESDVCYPHNEKEFIEFENRMCVKYMIEEMNLAEKDIFHVNYSREGILQDVQMRYCRK